LGWGARLEPQRNMPRRSRMPRRLACEPASTCCTPPCPATRARTAGRSACMHGGAAELNVPVRHTDVPASTAVTPAALPYPPGAESPIRTRIWTRIDSDGSRRRAGCGRAASARMTCVIRVRSYVRSLHRAARTARVCRRRVQPSSRQPPQTPKRRPQPCPAIARIAGPHQHPPPRPPSSTAPANGHRMQWWHPPWL
jgi:hypothetical protein